MVRSSYQSSLTPWSTNQLHEIRNSYQRSLTLWLTHKIMSWYWKFLLMPIDCTVNLQNTCDLELFLEVIYSLINWQTSCNWDLLSILVNSPINTQNNDGDLLTEGLPMSICKLEADGNNLYIHRIHEGLPLLLPCYVSPSVLHALVWWNLEESAPCLCSCSQNLNCGDKLSLLNLLNKRWSIA